MLDMECRNLLAELLMRVSSDESFRIAQDGACIEYQDGVSEKWTELNDIRALEKLWGEVMALNYKINCALRFMSYTIMTPVIRMYEVWLETGKQPEDQDCKLSAKVRRVLADLLGNLKDANGHTQGATTILDWDNETVYWSDEEAIEALFEELQHLFNLQSKTLAFAVEWKLLPDLMKQTAKIPKFSITW